MGANAFAPAKPSFVRVAARLHRIESPDIYYALVKRHGKQFRGSVSIKNKSSSFAGENPEV